MIQILKQIPFHKNISHLAKYRVSVPGSSFLGG